MKENQKADYPFPLDNPPLFHSKLLDYGERPYWSPDGKRIAFVASNYGDIHEIDFETRKVRNLTENLGDHHHFLRVLFLPNGDYLLIGPKVFKDRYISRRVESELWLMDKEAKTPPVPLGLCLFEGIGVSRFSNKITYSVNGNHDSSLATPDHFEVRVADIVYGENGPRLENHKTIYKNEPGFDPEPQDFRFNDSEVIMAEYHEPKGKKDEWFCAVKGVNVETGEVKLYISEPHVHNECEGIFMNEKYCCLESARDYPDKSSTDLWKLKLDGSMERCRMTRFINHYPWRATNSNVSPDGKWLAYMLNIQGSEPGYGMGLGLLDLEAWEKSDQAQQWEKPASWQK
jgi:hypothetical protein